MRSKYDGNDLVDFLEINPMEMREFMEAHRGLSPVIRYIVRLAAALQWV